MKAQNFPPKFKNRVVDFQHLRMTLFSNLAKIINKSSLPYMLEDFCSIIVYPDFGNWHSYQQETVSNLKSYSFFW